MKRILLLISFIIYSTSLAFAIEPIKKINKESDNTIVTNEFSTLERENIENILDLKDKDNKKFLESAIEYQNKIIDNMQWYIESLLAIIVIISAILGWFVWRENKKSRESMKEAKKDYKEAQDLYNNSFYKLNECYSTFYKKMNEITDLYEQKKQQLNTLYMEKERELKNIGDVVKKELKKNQKISNLVLEMNKTIDKENYSDALEKAKKIINLDDNNEWGYYGKATSLLNISNNEKQKLNDALDSIEKAIKINNDNELFKVTKAVIYGRLGKAQESLDIYTSLKDQNLFVLINMIEMKIIVNKILEANKDLSNISNKVKTNLEHQISFNILKMEIMCIENKDIQEIKEFVNENIFEVCKNKKIYWSFKEIKLALILDKNSYLNENQKNKLKEIIEYIEQTLKPVQ